MTDRSDGAPQQGKTPGAAEVLDTTADEAVQQPSPQKEDGTLPPFFALRFSTRAISLAVNALVLMQLTYYSTDIVGLPAALIGTLFLASKIFDAFTDLAIGIVIDRTRSRWGKARPYELFLVPIWLLTVAAFSTPDMGAFWQAAYIFVMFTLIHSVCQTALNGCEAVYLKRAAHGQVRHAKVLGRQAVFTVLVAGVANVLLPQMIAAWGDEPGGWTLITVIYGVPMLAVGLVRFFTIKELPTEEADAEEKPGLRDILIAVATNKYAFLLAAIILVANIVVHSGSIAGTYYFKYIFGDIGLLSWISLGSIIVPFTFLLFPLAVRTIGAMNFVRIGLVVAVTGYGMVFLFSDVLAIVVAGQLMGAMSSIITLLIGFFVIQTMAYGEWRTGKRIEAAMNAVVGFCTKVGMGLAPAIVGWVMGLSLGVGRSM